MAAESETRLTPQRDAVLSVVREARDHPTAAQVYDRVRLLHPTIAYATVYNALSYLVRHGLIREIKLGAGESCRYDGRLEPHLHLVCSQCGELGEVEQYLPESLLAALEATTGFQFSGQPVQLFGLCPRCAQASAPVAAN